MVIFEKLNHVGDSILLVHDHSIIKISEQILEHEVESFLEGVN